MKSKWMMFAFVASLLSVAGAAATIFLLPQDPLEKNLSRLPRSASACEQSGGVWTQFGDGNGGFGFFCRLKTTDAGKECASTSQCQGVCLAKSTWRNPLEHNACSDEVFLHGCFTEFSSGSLRSICQD
jgi:hypothetical protein